MPFVSKHEVDILIQHYKVEAARWSQDENQAEIIAAQKAVNYWKSERNKIQD